MKTNKLKTDVSTYVAQTIREARKAKGWTKYRLAEESGITCGHLHRIETGRMAIRTDVLQKICTALDLTITFPLPV